MFKYRYTVFYPILNFYLKNKNNGYLELTKEHGYQRNIEYNCNNWTADKIKKLIKDGYTHNVNATEVTGGDNDYLIIDHLSKQYCFWENGFYPFCGYYKNFPQDGDLELWAKCRK